MKTQLTAIAMLAACTACDFDLSGSVTPHGSDGAERPEDGTGDGTDTSAGGEDGASAGTAETDVDQSADSESGSTSPVDPGVSLVVFVTAASYSGAMGGLPGADAICQTEANAALLPGTYRAWLSSSSEHAVDRITGSGPWVTPAGQVVFNNAAGLQVGPLVPIDRGADGSQVAGLLVWTGTSDQGTALSPFCGEWQTPQASGSVGALGLTGQLWTEGGVADCSEQGQLYCLEIGDDVEDSGEPE